jgi:hypothetical protein
MLFRRRRSGKDRMVAAATRMLRSKRALTAAGVISSIAALTAASSSVSAQRQKQA